MTEENAARVFISYAHDDIEHEDRVREFWTFLRANGIDARLDKPAAERRQDWPLWMLRQVRQAEFVLVVASPAYRQRAEGEAPPGEGRGVQWEAALIREEVYADREAALNRFLPVVLPGCSAADIPVWLGPRTCTHYAVSEYTVPGAERLFRLLTNQAYETEPPLGKQPILQPRSAVQSAGRPVLRSELLINASLDGSVLTVDVELAGTPLQLTRESTLPHEVRTVWESRRAGPLVAAGRMLTAGRQLAAAVFDERSQQLVADLLHRLPPGDWVDVVWVAEGPALELPVELLRLTSGSGEDLGPLALRAGATVLRRVAGVPEIAPTVLPGPVKILAAVAAPDESRTSNAPLDTEAEMQAVLDAVAPVAGDPRAEVQILEVASVPQIVTALKDDAYHVLHLSAHGSADSIELEDEDGNPVSASATELIDALRRAGRPVPLILLSACSGGASGAEALGVGLIRRGADRVIAMQAPVSDRYATVLAASLYRELVDDPGQPVRQALTQARWAAEQRLSADRSDSQAPLPEYGVPTLLTAHGDSPLIDTAASPQPLSRVVVVPTGTSVRELAVGALIGRRRELRTTAAVLRRTSKAREQWGAVGGVQLVGVGGIGKTAIAGRVLTRLRADGWAVAVHEGRWDPTALISAVADVIKPTLPDAQAWLCDPALDDVHKLGVIRRVLAAHRLLLVFDDFEQNLSRPGGEDFLDPTVQDVLTGLCDSAEVGAVLVTSRYPLPELHTLLAEIPIPPLSPSELRRLFLRLPALRDLDPDDRRLLYRTVGGHPRLIEFVDALLRGGRANLKQIQTKLRDLARREGIDISRPLPLGQAIDQAMLLGSADILFDELLGLLTPRQRALLDQVAVSRAPMRLGDLAYALDADPEQIAATDLGDLQVDVDRLADLTLLTLGAGIGMHPWTAELLEQRADSLTEHHQRALAMRMRRFSDGVTDYLDLLDVARHLAALGRYDDLASFAGQASQVLPGTLAVAAFLAEVRPLLPVTERAWILVADLELNTFLAAGDLSSAVRLSETIHKQVETRATADPTNTGWQRDLSVSHNKLADLAVAAGDLTTAQHRYQAALDIAERLATADPTNTGWQRDLSISHNKLADLAVAAGDLTTASQHYQTDLAIAELLAAKDPTNTTWQRDLSISRQRLDDLANLQREESAAQND